MSGTRIGLIGAGVIGRAHAAVIRGNPSTTLVAIADPSEAGRNFAESVI